MGHYFFLGKKLMYLDPHVTQSTVVCSNATNIPDEVCLCIVNLFMRKVFQDNVVLRYFKIF